MPIENRMTKEQYKNEINRVHGSRKARTVRKNNTKTKTLLQAVPPISGLQGFCSTELYKGPFKIEVDIHGKCRGDIDNVLKGILDSLNGFAYADDRQCREARVRLR